LSKDKKKQQVHDDDVRGLTEMYVATASDWDSKQESQNELDQWYFNNVMHLADPNELRTRSLRHYAVWLTKQCDLRFASFKWPRNYFETQVSYRYFMDNLLQEIEALLHEANDTYGGSP
jgi:hypothetical protein